MEVKKGNHAGGTGIIMHQREENHRSGRWGDYALMHGIYRARRIIQFQDE